MRSNPNRFLHATLCFENLSSGENLAGCADNVGFPSGPVFCSIRRGQKKRAAGGEFRDDEFSIEISVFQRREKKTTTKPSDKRATNEQQRYRCDVKFSYLERVHALPVLVQVVHEIHDDDGKKKKNFQQQQRVLRKFCGRKLMSFCQTRQNFLRRIFVLRERCVLRYARVFKSTYCTTTATTTTTTVTE